VKIYVLNISFLFVIYVYLRYYYVVIMIELFVVVLPFMVCLSGICDAIGNGKVRLHFLTVHFAILNLVSQ
jgi:hypothetical protein